MDNYDYFFSQKLFPVRLCDFYGPSISATSVVFFGRLCWNLIKVKPKTPNDLQMTYLGRRTDFSPPGDSPDCTVIAEGFAGFLTWPSQM